MTCFGCRHIVFIHSADGLTFFGCQLIPTLVNGESFVFGGMNEPRRCSFFKDKNASDSSRISSGLIKGMSSGGAESDAQV